MALTTVRGGSPIETVTPAELRAELERWEARQRAEADNVKRMEIVAPIQPAATTFFASQANFIGTPDEGYVWSLKLVSVLLAAAGNLTVYKASTAGDLRRPISAIPASPGVTYTTQTAPTFPATGVAVQNTTNQAYTVVLSAGGATITNVSVNGITVGTGAGTYVVPAYGSISVAYSVATPSWTWTATQTSIPGLTTATATWSSDQAELKHGEGVYLVASQNITGIYMTGEQVTAEKAVKIYD